MGTQTKREMGWKSRFKGFLCCRKPDDVDIATQPSADPGCEVNNVCKFEVSKVESCSEVRPKTVDWALAVTRGLGAPCEICGDDRRVATHAAPCGHSACSDCWRRWPDACMFCNLGLSSTDVLPAPAELVEQESL